MARILLVAMLGLSACVSVPYMPGETKEFHSQVDGSRELVMEPAFCGEDRMIKLGIWTNTKMKPDEARLTIMVPGVYSIGNGESLIFNIDGELFTLKTNDKLTDFDRDRYGKYSSKDYAVSIDFLNRLNSSKKVSLKIVSNNNTFRESGYDAKSPNDVRSGVSEFLAKAKSFR